MRRVQAVELRRFLLDRLGLAGPLRPAAELPALAAELAMIQIDSIRVAGLRNHELAWLARGEAGVADFYAMLYGRGEFIETHYPVFAVRRDWLPILSTALLDQRPATRIRRRRLKPQMQKMEDHIRAHGAVGPADFDSRRVVGGFNTIKSTTRALEQMWSDRRLQISGRTPHFHRLFDLTERVLPELADAAPPTLPEYERFLLRSALQVLKIATAEQWADRVRLHYGSWRGESIRRWRELVKAEAEAQAVPVEVVDLPGRPIYWHLASDSAGWEAAGREARPEDPARIIPPLDNLLFSRKRFSALFGFDYKFEAYTPQDQRKFYFAKPIVHGDRVVALLDAKRADGEWRIVGYEQMAPAPPEALRQAVHRLARIAGAAKVGASTRLTRELRRALVGKIEQP
ncbi:MAG TPA: crosslink repair DNA glycosylase YcaQ family protein [Verrucomicrobiae bacterium]|nr:crosslink repair DNA glycosylase YcaQ family protein [Verrucomicrobiae bacterium]